MHNDDGYANKVAIQGSPMGGSVPMGYIAGRSPTVAENIERQISMLQERVERLLIVRDKLSRGDLLDISIDDLQAAMGRF